MFRLPIPNSDALIRLNLTAGLFLTSKKEAVTSTQSAR